MDVKMAEATRGKFARVCIEINLDQPVVGRVWFRGRWFHVEYEGLHLLCKRCGIFGHVSRNCTVATESKGEPAVNGGSEEQLAAEGASPTQGATKENPNETGVSAENHRKGDLYGDWLVVNKGKRQPQNKSRQRSGVAKEGKVDSRDSRRKNSPDNKFKILARNEEGGFNPDSIGTNSFVHGAGATQAEPTRTWAKKKRTRTDPPPLKKNIYVEGGSIPFGPVTSKILMARTEASGPNGVKDTEAAQSRIPMQTAQASTPQEQCTHAHGIKSAVHVKVVAPNKLMFIDEPEPLDDKGDAFGKGGIDHMEGVEDAKAMSEENDTKEIVAETPHPGLT